MKQDLLFVSCGVWYVNSTIPSRTYYVHTRSHEVTQGVVQLYIYMIYIPEGSICCLIFVFKLGDDEPAMPSMPSNTLFFLLCSALVSKTSVPRLLPPSSAPYPCLHNCTKQTNRRASTKGSCRETPSSEPTVATWRPRRWQRQRRALQASAAVAPIPRETNGNPGSRCGNRPPVRGHRRHPQPLVPLPMRWPWAAAAATATSTRTRRVLVQAVILERAPRRQQGQAAAGPAFKKFSPLLRRH